MIEMGSLKLPNMSNEQSKKWLNNLQHLENLDDEDLQTEINELKKRKAGDDEFSELDQEKLENAVWEQDRRDDKEESAEKEGKEEAEAEEKLSRSQKIKRSTKKFLKRIPVGFLRLMFFLFSGVAIFCLILSFVRGPGMIVYAFIGMFVANLFNQFADRVRRMITEEGTTSINISETMQEQFKPRVGTDNKLRK